MHSLTVTGLPFSSGTVAISSLSKRKMALFLRTSRGKILLVKALLYCLRLDPDNNSLLALKLLRSHQGRVSGRFCLFILEFLEEKLCNSVPILLFCQTVWNSHFLRGQGASKIVLMEHLSQRSSLVDFAGDLGIFLDEGSNNSDIFIIGLLFSALVF